MAEELQAQEAQEQPPVEPQVQPAAEQIAPETQAAPAETEQAAPVQEQPAEAPDTPEQPEQVPDKPPRWVAQLPDKYKEDRRLWQYESPEAFAAALKAQGTRLAELDEQMASSDLPPVPEPPDHYELGADMADIPGDFTVRYTDRARELGISQDQADKLAPLLADLWNQLRPPSQAELAAMSPRERYEATIQPHEPKPAEESFRIAGQDDAPVVAPRKQSMTAGLLVRHTGGDELARELHKSGALYSPVVSGLFSRIAQRIYGTDSPSQLKKILAAPAVKEADETAPAVKTDGLSRSEARAAVARAFFPNSKMTRSAK